MVLDIQPVVLLLIVGLPVIDALEVLECPPVEFPKLEDRLGQRSGRAGIAAAIQRVVVSVVFGVVVSPLVLRTWVLYRVSCQGKSKCIETATGDSRTYDGDGHSLLPISRLLLLAHGCYNTLKLKRSNFVVKWRAGNPCAFMCCLLDSRPCPRARGGARHGMGVTGDDVIRQHPGLRNRIRSRTLLLHPQGAARSQSA